MSKKTGLVLLMLIGSFFSAYSQTIIKGVVRDALTKEVLQSVSVYFKGGKGVVTEADGTYTISSQNTKYNTLVISYVGYKPVTRAIVINKEQVIDVDLALAEGQNIVVTTNKRGKYTNKNNPAVELIKHVIDNKDENRVTNYDYVEHEQYEKIELSLTNKPEKLKNNKLLKKFTFILDNVDTTKIEGKSLLPVFLEEKLSQKYYRKSPERTKTFELADKRVNFGDYIDNAGISTFLKRLYENVDIYQNNIFLFTNQFLSPIADMAPTFYRFYIADTVELEGVKLIRLNFSPKNLNDMLFRGTMFVTLDGNYSVQKINLSISKHANLNWVRELKIDQDFEKGPDGRFHVVNSNMLSEFALTRGADGGILGERTISYNNFTINKPVPDSLFEGDPVVEKPDKNMFTDSFWVAHRRPQLTPAEAKTYTNVDSLINLRSYKRFMDIATLLLAGYKAVGPDYEIGPVSAFYSFNPVEGFRLRVGGRSTPNFSRRLYFENYVAYGFKDEKFKYFLSGAYSFNNKSIYSYPYNYLKLSYQNDTKIPGQDLQFVSEDNFLLSFKRGNNDKWLYNNTFKAEYVREFANKLSYTLGYKYWKQTPAGSIYFLKPGDTGNNVVDNIVTSELSLQVRWAPHEQFYQGKVYRIPIVNKYPVFNFRYAAGIKGLARGQYNYQNVNMTVNKRFYLSQLGYSDITLEGGYIFGQVPYPLLTIHRANQTYGFQLNSYNLMNFMEFVSDHYAAVNFNHYFNGFIFNKIPLLKKLKLREVVTAKLLYGGVRTENDPNNNNEALLKFPNDPASNLSSTYSLNKKPYVEVSAGVGNIFKLLRVDLVKRLTYLNNPEVAQWGVRWLIKFDF